MSPKVPFQPTFRISRPEVEWQAAGVLSRKSGCKSRVTRQTRTYTLAHPRWPLRAATQHGAPRVPPTLCCFYCRRPSASRTLSD
jgi:hypothetical protein